MTDLRQIRSIEEIVAFIRLQADLRAEENDEAGVLDRTADELEDAIARLYEEEGI